MPQNIYTTTFATYCGWRQTQ